MWRRRHLSVEPSLINQQADWLLRRISKHFFVRQQALKHFWQVAAPHHINNKRRKSGIALFAPIFAMAERYDGKAPKRSSHDLDSEDSNNMKRMKTEASADKAGYNPYLAHTYEQQ